MEKQSKKSNVEILIKGSRFRGTNGVAWGPDDLIWMGSIWTGGIYAIDPETGETKVKVDAAKGTDDLAFHPDGRLFWNDIGYGEIGCRIPDGKTSIFATIGPGNNGMAISKSGRLFVSQLYLGSKLYEIYPDGKREPREVADLGKHMSNGMDFGPDGNLYGSAMASGEVIRIDTETGAVEVLASGVGMPSAVKFNSKGELHVITFQNGTVSKVDIKTGKLELVAQMPFPATDNMCFSPDDRLFVSSAAEGYLWEVTGKHTQRVVIQGGFGVVGGVTLTEAQGRTNLMAVDAFAIRKFDPDSGEPISTVLDQIANVGMMLTVNNHGKLLVTTSWPANFVKIWDPEKNDMVVNFDKIKAPTNAISIGDDLVFCDLAGTVQRLDPKAPDKPTVIAKGLKQPFGLAYDNGNLYVSDELDGKILMVMEGGKTIAAKAIKDGLNAPQGLALDGGKLLVVEAGTGKLLAIDLSNDKISTLADGMEFVTGKLALTAMPEWPRASIAISGGIAYIVGTKNADMYKVAY